MNLSIIPRRVDQKLAVPAAMMGCIQMPTEELLLLRALLNKALRSMETR